MNNHKYIDIGRIEWSKFNSIDRNVANAIHLQKNEQTFRNEY